MGKLTLKQEKFCIEYVKNGGNATAAARDAGYKGNDNTLSSVGDENLRKPAIIDRLKELQAPEVRKDILSIEQRRKMLTDIAIGMSDGSSQGTTVALKALEILNKMDGIYVTKNELNGKLGGTFVLKWDDDDDEYSN